MDRTEERNTDKKRLVGDSAAALVENGMVVGLGTGSTTAFAIQALGRRVDEGLDIKGIPTSYQSLMLAIEWGIPITSLDQDPVPDIALDGADQVDANLFVIKGGGAAHTNEKIISRSSRRFVVLVDENKMVDTLFHPVPLEVIPKALELVKRQVMELGGIPLLRMAVRKDGPVITDNGNLVLDVDFGEIAEPGKLAVQLSACTGIIEHGIFDNADEVYVGTRDGTVRVVECKR